jgi:SOS response regulatory protein OraA/RecX
LAKLGRAGFGADACRAAVGRLERDGYVDDARFAVRRAEHLAGRGYGDAWIRGDLDLQGVPAHLSEAAVAALEPERVRALGLAERLGGGRVAARKLERRGFAEESLERLVDASLHTTPPQE